MYISSIKLKLFFKELGLTGVLKHNMYTDIIQRLPLEEEYQVKDMLERVEPPTSPWYFLIILVKIKLGLCDF